MPSLAELPTIPAAPFMDCVDAPICPSCDDAVPMESDTLQRGHQIVRTQTITLSCPMCGYTESR